MDAIRTEGLTKQYTSGFWRPRPYVALDGLTLTVERGEVFGFLGPNGAGKTTTLKLLMQLLYPTKGSACILDRPVGDLEMRRRIGYLPENPSFYDNVTAEELLAYFAGLFGYRGTERTQRVSRLLDEVGLGTERRLQLRKYSKGMIQRVGLAQALLNDPDVVFLDEPMSGLDPLGRRDVREIILRLRDRGATVFFSSHILADAEALCSRVAILSGGRLAATGSLAEIVPFRIKGWELIVSDMTDAGAAALAQEGAVVNRIAADRHHLVWPSTMTSDEAMAVAVRHGGRLMSLNPMRDTLEDFFLGQIERSQPPRAAGARGGLDVGADLQVRPPRG